MLPAVCSIPTHPPTHPPTHTHTHTHTHTVRQLVAAIGSIATCCYLLGMTRLVVAY
jgi:hypothetical protein